MTGHWWRSSAYVILPSDRGPVIKPAPGAAPTPYDPWQSFRELEQKSRSQKILNPPYLNLVELGQNSIGPAAIARWLAGNVPEIVDRDQRAAFDFVNQFGLLGTIPTTTLSIRCPQFGKRSECRTYIRQGGGWSEHRQYLTENTPAPGVTRFGLGTLFYHDSPLQALDDYFPGMDLSQDVPLPNTPDFFAAYGEPILDILYVAREFAGSVLTLCNLNTSLPAHNETCRRRLSFLSQAAAPSFEFSPLGRYIEEDRKSAGLLASYALMFLWDLEVGRRIYPCQVCGRYFVSDDKRAKYCSRTHRLTASSRRYRATDE
jgi:hypothetical protein